MQYSIRKRLLAFASLTAMATNVIAPTAMAAVTAANDGNTTTPIKHVIIIVGENRTFDHLFATYVPPTGTVSNLLSKGIVNADGTPGKNVRQALQYNATTGIGYNIHPTNKTAYKTLPPLLTAGAPTTTSATAAPVNSLALAEAVEPGLETTGGVTSLFPNLAPGANGNDAVLVTTGATGLPKYAVDTRVANAAAPPNAPIPLTGGKSTLTYDDYASSPVHRFYQMFQQMDCSAATATAANPSGCLMDLFPWVEATIGAGSNGKAQAAGFNNTTTGEGSTAMGFYNVNNGDMPYFKMLADTYALGDNYHQPVKGGTGSDSVILGFGALPYYTAPNGEHVANSNAYPNGLKWIAQVPPANQIENPNPAPGTNNWYTQDGYSGGTYSECANNMQPGVNSIRQYMAGLSYKPAEICMPGQFYLLNNYNPGYLGNGHVAPLGPTTFTIPPQSIPSIANTLDAAQVSWTYYGEGWNQYAGITTAYDDQAYCNICNPFLYQQYVMENPTKVANNLKDTTDFYADVKAGVLPAVSYVKPGGLNDGHPSSSKFDIFEAFTKKIIDAVQAQPALWADTAIFVTVDEGGGYYDSGFVQTVDWAGDGTRIPMIVVSPYSKGVGPVHSYGDHASFLKFVNMNWGLKPITATSRDNLPNPIATTANPYVPTNMPAIDDLSAYFKF